MSLSKSIANFAGDLVGLLGQQDQPDLDDTRKNLREILPAACLIHVKGRTHSDLIYLLPDSRQFKERIKGLPLGVRTAIQDTKSPKSGRVFVYSPPSTPRAYGFLVGANAARLSDIKDLSAFQPLFTPESQPSLDPLAIVLSAYAFRGTAPASTVLRSNFASIFSRIVPEPAFDYRHRMPSTDESPLTLLCIGNAEFQQHATCLPREGMGQKIYSSRLKDQIIRNGLEPLLQASSASVPPVMAEALPYESPQADERAALARP